MSKLVDYFTNLKVIQQEMSELSKQMPQLAFQIMMMVFMNTMWFKCLSILVLYDELLSITFLWLCAYNGMIPGFELNSFTLEAMFMKCMHVLTMAKEIWALANRCIMRRDVLKRVDDYIKQREGTSDDDANDITDADTDADTGTNTKPSMLDLAEYMPRFKQVVYMIRSPSAPAGFSVVEGQLDGHGYFSEMPLVTNMLSLAEFTVGEFDETYMFAIPTSDSTGDHRVPPYTLEQMYKADLVMQMPVTRCLLVCDLTVTSKGMPKGVLIHLSDLFTKLAGPFCNFYHDILGDNSIDLADLTTIALAVNPEKRNRLGCSEIDACVKIVSQPTDRREGGADTHLYKFRMYSSHKVKVGRYKVYDVIRAARTGVPVNNLGCR
jgi:hypothetical protein